MQIKPDEKVKLTIPKAPSPVSRMTFGMAPVTPKTLAQPDIEKKADNLTTLVREMNDNSDKRMKELEKGMSKIETMCVELLTVPRGQEAISRLNSRASV